MCVRGRPWRIDPCLRNLVHALKNNPFFTVLASCCGHGVYPMTIVVRGRSDQPTWELMTGAVIPRKRNFYRKDAKGRYYIPEATKTT